MAAVLVVHNTTLIIRSHWYMAEETKIVFLECDGVVNPLSGALFSPPHMERLKRIVCGSAARLVLSGPWKAGAGQAMVVERLAAHGISTFLDVTPDLPGKPRAVEMLTWLGANKDKYKVVNFVALSDTALAQEAPHPGFFALHSVRTNGVKGLADEDVVAALLLLGDDNNLSKQVNLQSE